MITTDVLIVGAGPAGSVCGSLVHKSGIDCLLIGRATFPRDKICGGGLSLFSSLVFFFVKQMCRHPKAIKWLFDTKMRREKWI